MRCSHVAALPGHAACCVGEWVSRGWDKDWSIIYLGLVVASLAGLIFWWARLDDEIDCGPQRAGTKPAPALALAPNQVPEPNTRRGEIEPAPAPAGSETHGEWTCVGPIVIPVYD